MRRLAAFAVLLLSAGVLAQVQERDKPEHFSPLGFEDLRAYLQAYPGDAGSLPVLTASSGKYWVFRGIAYRGSQAQDHAWASLGPLSTTAGGAGGTGNFSGRVSTLAIAPACEVNGPCRLWVGTAGGGVWRTDRAMDPSDPQWRWIGQGLGTNSIGALALDGNDGSGNTIYVGTGETNTPQNSGAGTGLYRSTDGGDHWTRVSTNIVDRAVSPSAIDFTSTRGISSIVIEPQNPSTIYVGTTTAMLGMTAVRGGQSQITGYPQPRPGLYKTTDGGSTWTLAWVPPLDPVIPPNPNATVGQGDTMIGVRAIALDPRDARTVYVTAWNNAIHRSSPRLENGDLSFKPVFAIEGAGRFQDLAMFALTTVESHTRIYAYAGTLDVLTQALYRVDNADVPAATLVTGSADDRLAGLLELRPVRVAMLLRSRRRHPVRPARHGAARRRRPAAVRRRHYPIHRRRRQLPGIRQRHAPQQRTLRRARHRVSPEGARHRVRRIRRRRRPQRRHVRERRDVALRHQPVGAMRELLLVRTVAALLPEPRPADPPVLQRLA
jgi:hypothetical protein